MESVIVLLIYLTACLTFDLIACDSCWQINSRQMPYYKLIKPNARSNQLVLSTATARNVNECRIFATVKKALAFNYGREMDYNERSIDIQSGSKITRKICQALQCPEIHNFTTIVEDRNFDYYSVYPSFIAAGSSFTLACVPKTGMFVFSNNRLNYSQARTACQKMNASLAHIISEERTNGLAKYIALTTPAFVGLSNRNHEKSWKNEFDEPLFCFNFRAWGKGQPTHSRGCVGLVQPAKSESGPFWKVMPCNTILPFICEISPIY
ncbi:unnamed protein product [Xylocopa violacea]|uniref:C-type lectin domain-containing protein n=1 Tax=Xylocopa violacea TaxID=135666 RepID=A0ABP1N5Y3_XYLVO